MRDLDKMQAFYQDVVGLTLLRRLERIAFLRVADGYGGHAQIVGLFADDVPPPIAALRRSAADAGRSTLHHFALEIALDGYEAQVARLQAIGVPVTTLTHPWIGWRSIYIADPEDNVVEFVCFDPRVLSPPAS